MQKKNLMIVGILLVISVFLAWLVIAAAGEGVRITSPASNTNYTTITAVLFNVSFINGTDITNPANATFLINLSGTWTPIGNTTPNSTGCQVGATTSSCAVNITNTTIPDGFYSINVTIYNATNTISVTNTTNVSTRITIDGTSPQSFPNNFTGEVIANKNLSSKVKGGVYYLNASLIDATIGIQTVIFNLTNLSGTQNATFTGTREGSTSYYSVSINTSIFPDGTYNVTIFVNDTFGNLNNSARAATIRFDDTAPTVSFSCSPTSVEQNDVITCSCSATDSTAGLNTSYGSSGVSFTTKPSTAQTGPSFSTGCSSQDLAGNTKSSTVTYSVTSGGGSGGGSSGGGSSSGGSSGGGLSPPSTSESSSDSEANAGSGASGRSQGAAEQQETSSKAGLIIAAIIILAIVIVVAVMLKRKNQ